SAPESVSHPICLTLREQGRIRANARVSPRGRGHSALRKELSGVPVSSIDVRPIRERTHDQRSLVQDAIGYCLSVGTYVDGDGIGDFQGLIRFDCLHGFGLGITAV